jgi:hypothetical protein
LETAAVAQSNTLIQPPNTLRMKVGARSGGGLDPALLAKAEAALKSLSSQFSDWMQEELARLEEARALIHRDGLTTENVETLYLRAHDLKGLGTTYEFPIVTRMAGSLCKLLDEPAKRDTVPLYLVDAHIDAIKAAVRQTIRSFDHPVGKVLVTELETRVAEYLA